MERQDGKRATCYFLAFGIRCRDPRSGFCVCGPRVYIGSLTIVRGHARGGGGRGCTVNNGGHRFRNDRVSRHAGNKGNVELRGLMCV